MQYKNLSTGIIRDHNYVRGCMLNSGQWESICEPLIPPKLKQKTAIIRALKQRYEFNSVRFQKNGHIVGRYNDGVYMNIGHIDDIHTSDHNGHSTRVYNRHFHIGTIFGTIKFN